jgi:uncharacterized RDD family membrane protein YckC
LRRRGPVGRNDLERNVSVRTPESIAFYYELAGLGSRFLAVALDLVIQIFVGIAIVLLAIWAAPGAQALAQAMHLGSASFQTIVFAIAILMLFLVYSGYFIAFETLWNGQTPGKRLIGIRVVRDGGYPIGFMDSVIRNLIRVIEAAFAYAPSIVSALLSSENKRLGDLAAGTIVVRDRAFEMPHQRSWMSGDDENVQYKALPGIELVTDDEFALVERYVSRSHMLEPQAAQAAAARIASTLRQKLGPDTARFSDHELLVRVASARRR